MARARKELALKHVGPLDQVLGLLSNPQTSNKVELWCTGGGVCNVATAAVVKALHMQGQLPRTLRGISGGAFTVYGIAGEIPDAEEIFWTVLPDLMTRRRIGGLNVKGIAEYITQRPFNDESFAGYDVYVRTTDRHTGQPNDIHMQSLPKSERARVLTYSANLPVFSTTANEGDLDGGLGGPLFSIEDAKARGVKGLIIIAATELKPPQKQGKLHSAVTGFLTRNETPLVREMISSFYTKHDEQHFYAAQIAYDQDFPIVIFYPQGLSINSLSRRRPRIRQTYDVIHRQANEILESSSRRSTARLQVS